MASQRKACYSPMLASNLGSDKFSIDETRRAFHRPPVPPARRKAPPAASLPTVALRPQARRIPAHCAGCRGSQLYAAQMAN